MNSPPLLSLTSTNFPIIPSVPRRKVVQIESFRRTTSCSCSLFSLPFCGGMNKSAPFAASVTVTLSVLLWSLPANAGLMSGVPGIESIPGPKLPSIEFLDRLNEENQKKYAENDERFKQSPLLQKLLEKSKQNKEKNRKEILDKYCIRGAEWGVGDCSTAAMSPQEREDFIAALKKKAGVE